MSWEHINLNMTPGGEMPIVHVSQFDTYRAFTFNLFVGEDEWTIPEGISFELHCRKVDDNIVIIEPDSTDTSSVTFITTDQLTACAGKNKCELVAIDTDDDSLIIGSINFILDVEADPLAGGLTSETAIYNLTQQIEDITQEVIGDDYYNKTETDALLADKADVSDLPDMTDYYTKTQTNTLLSAKADSSSVYTKSQVDSALAAKADSSSVYTKSQVDSALAAKANSADLAMVATSGDYDDLINKPTIPAAQIQSDYAQADNTQVDYIKNKPNIAGMIADALLAVMPVETVGPSAMCNFNTDIAANLVNVKCTIVASGGGGTPSTPIPIVGYTELNLTHNGTTDTIDLGSTVYGGELDVTTGVLTITHAYEVVNSFSGSSEGNGFRTNTYLPETVKEAYGNLTCNMFTRATNYNQAVGQVQNAIGYNAAGQILLNAYDDGAYVTTIEDLNALIPAGGCQIVYELATPQTVQLTPTQVQAILGDNNVFADTGNTTVQYKVSIQKYVDEQ